MENSRSVSNTSTVLVAGLGILAFWIYAYFGRRGKAPLPPGPFSLPLIGNIFHYPPQYPWFKFTEWKDQFGEIVRLHGLGNEVVILNSLETINDLLVKQGHLYAHRPVFTLATELMGSSRSMAMMSNTKTWQLHRKLAHTAFSQESVKKYHGIQEDIAAMMSIAFADDPEHFIDHIRLATGRIIMSVTYGTSPKMEKAEYIDHAEETQVMFTEVARPGASIVDVIPSLKHIPESTPFFTFHALAKRGKAMIHKMVYPPFEFVKEQIESGKPTPPSFVSELLTCPVEAHEDRHTFEEAVTWVAAAMYGGGVDTTYSVVLNAILAMILYPEVQRIAQEELDTIVGDRLPTIADRKSTPYLNAVIKEALRWYPPVPLGLAHRSAEDVIYKGYLIPKDAIIVPNLWAVSRISPSEFPPDKFIPERFMQDKSNDIPDPIQYIFGFGRRVCPGRYLAENSMYILIASLVACFDFTLPLDTTGKQVPFDPTWKASLTSYPNPFKCGITPRSVDKVAQFQQHVNTINTN